MHELASAEAINVPMLCCRQFGGASTEVATTSISFLKRKLAEVCPTSSRKNHRELREVDLTDSSYVARIIGECRDGLAGSGQRVPCLITRQSQIRDPSADNACRAENRRTNR